MYVIQSLLFFTYVHERVFHLYTKAILALKFEADKECFNLRRQRSCQTCISGVSVKIHAVGTPKKCLSKALRVDSTCRIHKILSKIIWSIRFLVVHTILNRWILPSSTFAFNELRNFLRNKI